MYWRSSQSGSLWVQNFHLSRVLRTKKGMVLTQVSCDELWEISFIDHLQEHVCCCMKCLFSPEEEWWLISSWKNYVTLHLHLVWYIYSQGLCVFSPVRVTDRPQLHHDLHGEVIHQPPADHQVIFLQPSLMTNPLPHLTPSLKSSIIVPPSLSNHHDLFSL